MRVPERAKIGDAGMGLQITPMIDLVFLLLIYFLLTLATKTQEGLLTTETPSGQGAVAQTEEDLEEKTALVRIVRAAEGVGLFFRDWPVAGYRDLADQLRSLPADTPILLEAAPDVAYRDVVRVHNIAIKTGHRNVVYTIPPA